MREVDAPRAAADARQLGRLRATHGRVVRLENRRPFTGLASSNFTLSAKLDWTALDPEGSLASVRFKATESALAGHNPASPGIH